MSNERSSGETVRLGPGKLSFPPYPGDSPLKHEAQAWLERAEPELASRFLLDTANTGRSARAEAVELYDLSVLQQVPPSHKYYHSRQMEIMKYTVENRHL